MPYRNKHYDQFINTDLVSTSYEALQYDAGIVGCINLMQTYMNGKFSPPIYKDPSFTASGDEVWISHTIDRRKALKDIGKYYDAYRDINNYFCFQSGINEISSFQSFHNSEISDDEYYIRYKTEVPDSALRYSEVTGWEPGPSLHDYMTGSVGYGADFADFPSVFNVAWIDGNTTQYKTFSGSSEPADLWNWSDQAGSRFYISSLVKLYEYNKLSKILYSNGGPDNFGRGIYGGSSYLKGTSDSNPILTVDPTLQHMAKKIQDLASIKDPDLIDYEYIGELAKYMGVDFDTSIDGIITNYAYGEESRENTLRNFLSHMPEFNKIKGCTSMLESVLLSVGITAKIIPLYRNITGSYIRQDLVDSLLNSADNITAYKLYREAAGNTDPNEWYPSTHFNIDISSGSNTPSSDAQSKMSANNISDVTKVIVTKFKPATTVIGFILLTFIDNAPFKIVSVGVDISRITSDISYNIYASSYTGTNKSITILQSHPGIVKYSLDGSDPMTGPIYTAETGIQIDGAKTLKAVLLISGAQVAYMSVLYS